MFCEVNQIFFGLFYLVFLLQITQSSLASPDLPTDRVTAHVTAHVTTTSDHVTMTTDHMTATADNVTISQSISCSNTQKYKENELLKQSGTLVQKKSPRSTFSDFGSPIVCTLLSMLIDKLEV